MHDDTVDTRHAHGSIMAMALPVEVIMAWPIVSTASGELLFKGDMGEHELYGGVCSPTHRTALPRACQWLLISGNETKA